ncbi:threonylcarbamoyl-AMP synthase [Bombilactobacillus folatiphilus]|uniref:Threonylcarbamoyl-AMP synthase n=1 Tax=Bombilactobacillus folatiphilus TaxID=2923362 RepID=A0ABY4PAU6_9LACO|nr:L-threonylcarbamoyladenylate synthase [Bombilactobacillus folatiphilus]UQS82878.1 threonylcarbamoyl-AMP synthase [Bombilactobacillus folatiphilus]
METKMFTKNDIAQAAKLLAEGQLVAFPTETVYGLGADATNPQAAAAVYQAKGRPSDNPLIVHVNSANMVWQYAAPTYQNVATKLMQTFWPGPLTIILPVAQDKLSKTVTGGLQTAAFRMPDNQLTLQLITQLGKPLVGPSANTSGKPSPTLPEHVYHDLHGKIAGILADGPTRVGLESTVLDLTSSVPTILRPGALTQEQLAQVIGTVQSSHHKVQAGEIPKAPGMKYKHYAPKAQVVIVDHPNDFEAALTWVQQTTKTFAVMATDAILQKLDLSQATATFSLGDSLESASHLLFAGLRQFDLNEDIEYILAQGSDDQDLGIAYMNRLNKSAGNNHFK